MYGERAQKKELCSSQRPLPAMRIYTHRTSTMDQTPPDVIHLHDRGSTGTRDPEADGRPFRTLQSCPTFDLTKYLHQLRQSLPRVPPIPAGALKALHAVQDYEGMLRLIKKTMNIESKLRVGWVNKGGSEDAPAWVEVPPQMPLYGSKEFREMTIQVYFRKSFLAQSTYDQVAIVVAHELSHVVLDSIWHPLRRCEKAVDLTAMVLGFRRLYASGSYKEYRSYNSTSSRQLGYLSPQEVQLVNQALARDQPSWAWELANRIFAGSHRHWYPGFGRRQKQVLITFGSIGMCMAVGLWIFGSISTWQRPSETTVIVSTNSTQAKAPSTKRCLKINYGPVLLHRVRYRTSQSSPKTLCYGCIKRCRPQMTKQTWLYVIYMPIRSVTSALKNPERM